MGTDGRKMSKSFGNYPDPKKTLEKYGAESLRLYFMGSKIMNGEDLNLSEEDIREQYNVLNILWNSHKYLTTYTNLHKWDPSTSKTESKNILDKWILARTEEFIKDYSNALDEYDFVTSTRAIRPFVENLSTWYIRRSRDRFASGDTDALSTLYKALTRFALAVAPTLPFSAEAIYKNLNPPAGGGKESVHLEDYPKPDVKLVKNRQKLIEQMSLVREVTSVVHSLRSEAGHQLRQKLGMLSIKNLKGLEKEADLIELIRAEANVSNIEFNDTPDESFACAKLGDAEICLDTNLTEELKKEGLYREFVRALQDARKKAGLEVGQKALLKYMTSNALLKSAIEERKKELSETTHFYEIREGDGEIEILGGKAKIKIEK